MPKISFNAQAIGIAVNTKNTDMTQSLTGRAFQPVVVCRPGIEAIVEGLRLTNIQGFETLADQLSAKDVNT